MHFTVISMKFAIWQKYVWHSISVKLSHIQVSESGIKFLEFISVLTAFLLDTWLGITIVQLF